MSLNIYAAFAICVTVIGGAAYYINHVDLPAADLPTPLVIAPSNEPRSELAVDGPRGGWVRQFSHANAIDRQAAENQRNGVAPISAREPLGEEHDGLPPLVLPPLASDVATAPPAQERVEAEADVVLVSATAPPDDAAQIVADAPALNAGAPDAPAAPATYTVKKGDTLVRVVEQAYGSRDAAWVERVLAANPRVKARKGKILIGEALTLPSTAAPEPPPLASAAGDKSSRAAKEAKAPARTPDDKKNKAGLASKDKAGVRWYTVQRNDSLARIAKAQLSDADRWPEIAKLNKRLDPNRIVAGTRIKLPADVRVAAGG